jgi:hypothetical protein
MSLSRVSEYRAHFRDCRSPDVRLHAEAARGVHTQSSAARDARQRQHNDTACKEVKSPAGQSCFPLYVLNNVTICHCLMMMHPERDQSTRTHSKSSAKSWRLP